MNPGDKCEHSSLRRKPESRAGPKMDSGFHRNDGLIAKEPIKELVMQLLTHNTPVGHTVALSIIRSP